MTAVHPTRRSRRERGQALVLVALLFTVILGFAGLAVDAGHNYLARRDAQNAADAAVLAAGQQLIASGATPSSAPGATDSSVKAAHDFAANNGFSTTFPNNQCNVTGTSPSSFTATWFDAGYATPSSCSATSGFTTKVVLNVPPCGINAPSGGATVPFPTTAANCAGVDTSQNIPADCQSMPYDCMQVLVTHRTQNYVMGIFGQGWTYTTTNATVYAVPAGPALATPPPTAVYLYEPQNSCNPGGAAGVQCFDATTIPARSLESCTGTGGNCPTYLNVHGVNPAQFNGANGATLTPSGDQTVFQSKGDMVLNDNTTICDPTPSSGTTALSCSSNNTAVGAKGFALDTTGNASKLFCNGFGGGATSSSPLACTTGAPQNSGGKMNGNETTYSGQNYTVSVTAPTTDCGGLILNGDTVASSITSSGGNALCAPTAGDEFTIQPGRYSYIVINHGRYYFDPGIYDIYGVAPVDTATSGYANGIDHNGDGGDYDLCPSNHNNSCGGESTDAGRCTSLGGNGSDCLTAGVWITHGNLTHASGSSGSSSSCTGGTTVGTQAGGGDQTDVTGTGVTFLLESTSGGFVSTSSVQGITLASPGLGASQSVSGTRGGLTTSGIPVLFDLENNSFIHLDANGGNQNNFSGIIYQKPTATAGGVEIDPHLNNNSNGGAAVSGQILAYSLATFGGGGTAADFSHGYGNSSVPSISNSGHNETSIVNAASLAADSTGTNAVFTLSYTDEWALDAYDTYIQVGSNSAVFFSQNMWYMANPASQPPEPNGGSSAPGTYPSDDKPQYPTGSGTTYTGPSGTYSQALDPVTNLYTDYTETLPYQGGGTSKFETSGQWTWGHMKDITTSAPAGYTHGFTATVKYTFPLPSGSSISVTMGLYDGDHCGDYAIYTGTFNNPGQSNGGGQSNGTVLLEE